MPANTARATRGARLVVCAACLLMACSGDAADPVAVGDATRVLPPVHVEAGPPPVELHFSTYDGSGQVNEPDVLHFAAPWNGWEYWMAVNPYPNSLAFYENASIYVSHDGVTWSVPAGLVNPVVPGPSGDIVHNSDPELAFIQSTGQLVLFDRAVTSSLNVLRATSSTDGVHWRPMSTIIARPRHELISPTIVMLAGQRPRLWVVDAGAKGCETRATTVRLRRWTPQADARDVLLSPTGWSEPVATDLRAPDGWLLWHLDVTWVPERKEFWAVFPAHRSDESCAHDDLFVSRSADGQHWQTLREPILRRGAAAFADQSLYRSSMQYDPVARSFRVWLASLSSDGGWHVSYAAFPLTTLVAQIEHQPR